MSVALIKLEFAESNMWKQLDCSLWWRGKYFIVVQFGEYKYEICMWHDDFEGELNKDMYLLLT